MSEPDWAERAARPWWNQFQGDYGGWQELLSLLRTTREEIEQENKAQAVRLNLAEAEIERLKSWGSDPRQRVLRAEIERLTERLRIAAQDRADARLAEAQAKREALDEGARKNNEQWEKALGFAITGMRYEAVIAQVRTVARREAPEAAAEAVRAACVPCGGSGYDGFSATECEYCGRPMAAIRALMEKA